MQLQLVVTAACVALASANSSSSSSSSSSTPVPAATAHPLHLSRDEMCARGSSGAGTLVDYEFVVSCSTLAQSPTLALAALAVALAALLYLLSSTADAFFSPVLQVLVEKFRIPPDVAGVTFLSFGNGSPDVFANIAAFSLASPNIGVTSILGGGLLVTTGAIAAPVIAACVGLVSEGQDQLIPRKYIRDVTFYFVAVAYFCFVCMSGTVRLPEALGFLGIYACYALTVLFDRQLAVLMYAKLGGTAEIGIDDFYGAEYVASPPSSEKSSSSLDYSTGSSPRDTSAFAKPMAFDVFQVRDAHTGDVSYDSDSSSLSTHPPLQRKSSAPTPRSKRLEAPPTVHERWTELIGFRNLMTRSDDLRTLALQKAHERQSLLERTDTYLNRPASVCVSSMQQSRKVRRRRTAWESVEASAHFGPTARRWTRSYHHLSGIDEFPSSISETEGEDAAELNEPADVEGARGSVVDAAPSSRAGSVVACVSAVPRAGYTVFRRLVWNPFELVTTFARRLTIPLVDEETWDKNFAVACPPFIILAVGTSVFALHLSNAYFIGAVVLGGGLVSAVVELTTTHERPPEGRRLAPFVAAAFVMSVIWIMNIADELLGVLQTLGGLLGISNSVLGVSVLAWGNSIGDLVSNTSIARDGFPTMAFAGCFAGPMFNLLVGIGLALTLAVLHNGPVAMGKPTPLMYLGFGYLFASLALNLGMAAFDDFQYRRRLCYALLALYVSFAVLSIVVVLSYPE
ncbi:hypothetical protein PybrP1_006526 [[Pythium] brassicae (nom. inval.)]|nr:hypothetical protein PybrP1_006526 [[Pythium] brassicae (nom. inval.)]